MSQLQRCVIRDELVESAKLIQKRYCLRNWGDAVNMVFAACRHIYMEEGQPMGHALPSTPPVYGGFQPPRNENPPTVHASSSPSETDQTNLSSDPSSGNDLRGFMANLNYIP